MIRQEHELETEVGEIGGEGGSSGFTAGRLNQCLTRGSLCAYPYRYFKLLAEVCFQFSLRDGWREITSLGNDSLAFLAHMQDTLDFSASRYNEREY